MREGGFEPFGNDYQQGTTAGATENSLYLRLPGQWDDGTWDDATSGAGVYYNVNRWYQPGSGRYTRPDPLPMEILREASYAYANSNPVISSDPLGLEAFQPCSDLPMPQPCECDKGKLAQAAQTARKFRDEFCAYRNSPERPPGVPHSGEGGARTVGKIDPSLGPVYRPQGDSCRDFCVCEHERQHERDLKSPRVRKMILDGVPTQQTVNWLECRAYFTGTFCLQGFARGGIR
jgi:RHS repeat-associated protein